MTRTLRRSLRRGVATESHRLAYHGLAARSAARRRSCSARPTGHLQYERGLPGRTYCRRARACASTYAGSPCWFNLAGQLSVLPLDRVELAARTWSSSARWVKKVRSGMASVSATKPSTTASTIARRGLSRCHRAARARAGARPRRAVSTPMRLGDERRDESATPASTSSPSSSALSPSTTASMTTVSPSSNAESAARRHPSDRDWWSRSAIRWQGRQIATAPRRRSRRGRVAATNGRTEVGPPVRFCALTCLLANHACGVNRGRRGHRRSVPHRPNLSMRSSWLYFATRSLRAGAPV